MRKPFIVLIAAAMAVGCGKPGADSLRESFAQQLAANKFVTDFQNSGGEMRFTGPGGDGSVAKWRVHIDSASIEPNDDPDKPYKGVVKSSWYANDRVVEPRGQESNIPLELIATGLAQDCWALWNKSTSRWEWE